ncbi:MAG: PHP-associated domain-containing protein [Myxococcales bacterium]|nr:hypothetical protein [Myxococcota bacterium]MDW8282524.1 PHP-associated domain-containing protein [Myxococcales bacterium]
MRTHTRRWLKAELHAHCSLDPTDYKICPQSAEELCAEAARLGYDVLAITCHNLDVWTPDLADYARSLGLTLVPGMEVSVEGVRHALVYNFRSPAEELNTLDKIRARARADTLVVAPHPYFPSEICLGDLLARHIDVFDAIEVSGFYGRGVDFNRRARAVARAHRKPLIGNGDVHLMWQLGRTFTWIYAEPTVESILQAIKQGQVRIETRPYPYWDLFRFVATTTWREAFPLRSAPEHPPM